MEIAFTVVAKYTVAEVGRRALLFPTHLRGCLEKKRGTASSGRRGIYAVKGEAMKRETHPMCVARLVEMLSVVRR